MLKGTNQEFGRPYNRRIVLETIRLYGPISRGEIARQVGLTIQTVSTIARELEDLQLVVATREPPKGRGSPVTRLRINPEGGFSVGVHTTPRGIEAALVNLAGEVIGREEAVLPHPEPDRTFREITALTQTLKALRPDGRILGAGMAMPGPFDVESMSFIGPTTLEGWSGVPVQQQLAKAIGLPAFIEIDVAAAAHGERLYGAGRNFRDFYYVFMGVGLGGCMVHDGVVLRGSRGNAGELGHTPIVPSGDLCACGNRGCLERYVSIEAYDRRVAEIGEDAWLAEAAPIMRSAIVMIENLFDPETIILGGVASPRLMGRLISAAKPLPNSIAAGGKRVAERIILSGAGNDAVLRGAAALAISGILSPRFGVMFAEQSERRKRDPILESTNRVRVA